METNHLPPLSVELFARLTARIEAGARRDQVLASESVDVARWERTREYWLDRMSHEAESERFGIAHLYGKAFKAEQERIGDGARGSHGEPRAIRRGRIAEWRSAATTVAAAPTTSDAVGGRGSEPTSPLAPPHAATLTLEQLAAMRAELATTSEPEHPAIRERFGLDAASWAREEAHWQGRLRSDPELFRRYVGRFQYFRALLQRR
jgi:hypothetical protein